ncbi:MULTISPECIES: tail fiber domain-containing protein [unclassified Pseudomonas]|uniref:tail fiber domain-containing protein n=1 Tax=unclassified Pseudomonas TaxID=196821 RepID=UPI001F576205|nr:MULTISPECIES: tail fiber domain-containing protein [unclassified Pseudomonas]
MARQEINLGTAPTGAGGDTTRSAAAKMNAMSTEIYAALGGTNGTLPSALPISKGGTGVTDGRAIFTEVGVQAASGRYNIQGLYMGWNAAGLGEGHFIVNKGNGDGGFSWRSVNAGNTAGGPTMTYSYAGILSVPTISATGVAVGTLAVTNEVSVELPVRGIRCRTGLNGAYTANSYNFNWTGSNVDVYIGATYVGTMTLFGSDYRFKKYIKDAPQASYLDRIDAYRIVTYQRKNFGDVFKGDNVVYQGLIAHEAQEVNPLAVTGEKDGIGDDGQPRVQQLEPMALITDLMGAVKELRAELAALKAAQA